MTDDCGHIKDDGEPCKLPGSRDDGRCHYHTDVEGERVRGGRPTKLDDETYEAVMAAAERGLTYEGIARAAGIGLATLDDWRNQHDDFSSDLEKKRAIGEMELVQETRENRPEFILERSYGYTKEQEIEHTGDAFDVSLSPEEKEGLDELFDREPSTSVSGEDDDTNGE